MGLVLLQARKYDDAVAVLQRAVEIDPTDAHAHSQLGLGFDMLGKNAESRRHYRLALAGDPMDREANYLLGRRLVLDNEPQEAIPYLEKSLSAPEDEKTPNYLGALAGAYARAGEVELAISTMQKAKQAAERHNRADLVRVFDTELEALRKTGSVRPER